MFPRMLPFRSRKNQGQIRLWSQQFQQAADRRNFNQVVTRGDAARNYISVEWKRIRYKCIHPTLFAHGRIPVW